ncbi:MAG TPA: TorF family putative porin [Sphingomonas sp.]|uniref:TorF family putative porin n=1 Tax=Sphingomonas sp. TaxID=28214 RepID=UPI002B9FB277|nr:TorF family putative porin [Sphingomonas sp.]HMI20264.1 TorF family putative porin [Sphingomonas sp.]
MRTTLIGLSILAAMSVAAPALADDAPAAPASPWTINGTASVVSDYRFRGVSQTDKRFAVQGSFTLSHASGFYLSVWGSSIDDYVAAGGDQEIDLIGGYKTTLSGTTIDSGFLYYYYPGSGGANTDFFEPYLNASHTFGPVGTKVGLNYAWSQKGQSCSYDPRCGGKAKEDSLYTYGELSGAIPGVPLTFTGHLGESWGRSYLTNGLKNYTDWSLTAAYTWKALSFSVAYVDTDFKKGEFVVNGRNEVSGGVVATVGVAF